VVKAVTVDRVGHEHLFFVVLQRLANFAYMGAMYANSFVQLLPGNVQFFRPVVNVRRKLWIDDVRIVRPLLLIDFRLCGNGSRICHGVFSFLPEVYG
jgi:hypothetical protein